MSQSVNMLSQILPIILLIILGMILRKIRFIDQKTIDIFKKVVLNISLPAMLLMAFAQMEFDAKYLGIILTVFGVCLILLILANVVFKRYYPQNPYAPALMTGFETGMIGYALFAAVYGQDQIWRLAIIDLGQVLFVFFILVAYLNVQNGQETKVKSLLSSFLKSPVILAILIGLALGVLDSATGITTKLFSNNSLGVFKFLSDLTVPLITIAIGFELKFSRETLRGPFLTALARILIMFGIATLINQVLIVGLFHLDAEFTVALYTMFLLPPPFVIPIFMQEKRPENRQFVLNTLSVHVVLTLIAFTLIAR